MEAGEFIPQVSTTNTCLAAALAAVGIPMSDSSLVAVLSNRGERKVWMFEGRSPCGKYNTRKLIEAWDDPEWHDKNPEHPFAYIKCALRNREKLVDLVKKQVPLIEIRRKGKIVYLPADATMREHDRFMKHV
jgi:hypothetical protein